MDLAREGRLDVLVEILEDLKGDKERSEDRFEQGMGFAYKIALRFLKEALGQDKPDYQQWLLGKGLRQK